MFTYSQHGLASAAQCVQEKSRMAYEILYRVLCFEESKSDMEHAGGFLTGARSEVTFVDNKAVVPCCRQVLCGTGAIDATPDNNYIKAPVLKIR